MRKIVISVFLLLEFCIYSNCKYTSDPTIHERGIIKLIKKYNLDDKIYCTRDGEKLVYRTGDFGDYMQIGIVYNFKDTDTFIENIGSAAIDFDKIRDKLIPNNLSLVDKIDMPRYYNYRMYAYFEDKDVTLMIFNHILDTLPQKGEWEYYINDIWLKIPVFQEMVDEGTYHTTKYTIY